MRTRTAALLVAALATCVAVPRARADAGRAWAAAKANLPADSGAVVGVNVNTIRKSQLFAQLYPLLIAQKPEIQAGFDLAKSACNIDPLDAIESAVVGADLDQKAGAIYVALHGVDQAKLIACFESMARAKGDKTATVTVTKDGNVSELSTTGSADKIYLGWIGADVVVMSFDPKDKASLQHWMGGKGGLGKSPVGKPVGRINTAAAGWAVVIKDQELDPASKIHMKAGYGSVDVKSGNVAADLRLQLGTAGDATKLSGMASKQLGDAIASGAVPEKFLPMVKSIKIASSGSEIEIKGTAAETDILGIIMMVMSGAGH